jgi:hypothetical protein
MKPAVLIIDLLEDYFADGYLAKIRNVLVEETNRLVNFARCQQFPVVWVRQEFEPDLSDAFLIMRKAGIKKMTIRIQNNDSDVSWTDLASLFEAVRWGRREPDNLRSAFGKSTFKCFAFDDDRLVGFGRTIDDGKYMATVVDMIVHPRLSAARIGRSDYAEPSIEIEGIPGCDTNSSCRRTPIAIRPNARPRRYFILHSVRRCGFIPFLTGTPRLGTVFA